MTTQDTATNAINRTHERKGKWHTASQMRRDARRLHHGCELRAHRDLTPAQRQSANGRRLLLRHHRDGPEVAGHSRSAAVALDHRAVRKSATTARDCFRRSGTDVGAARPPHAHVARAVNTRMRRNCLAKGQRRSASSAPSKLSGYRTRTTGQTQPDHKRGPKGPRRADDAARTMRASDLPRRRGRRQAAPRGATRPVP